MITLRPVMLFVCFVLSALGIVPECRADEFAAPQGQIALSRPEISWKIWATNGRAIARTEMQLDGRTVITIYQTAQRALVYQPNTPLSAGTHTVTCRVQLDDGAIAQHSWSFSVSANAIPTLPTPNANQRVLFEGANRFRRLMGLPDFVLNMALCAAAQAHSQYAVQNPGEAHGETEGKPGFRGKSPTDRVRAMGYSGGAGEDMAWGNPKESITQLIGAPYHRLPFMEPGSPNFGGGSSEGVTTLNFHGQGGKGIVIYPIPEQTNVPLAFNGGETPNPLRMHPASGHTGYVITLAAFGMEGKLRFVRASLSDSSGGSVPFWVNSPENDNHLRNAVFVIPQKPLQSGTTYEVKIVFGFGNGGELDRTWRFTTQGKAANGARLPGFASEPTPKLPKKNETLPLAPIGKNVFPVAGKTSWSDSFNPNGERKMRTHHGQDLMAAKLTPLVACFDGVVSFGRTSTPNRHNILSIRGDNGLDATYMHINNDTPGTDDGLGSEQYAFAPGLQSGSRVYAGQLVAFVGDSGNAENTGAHCHFELYRGGECLNPKPFLDTALKMNAPLYLLTQRHLQPQSSEVRWEGCVHLADVTKRLLVLEVLATVLPGGKVKAATKPTRQYILFSETAPIQSRDDVPRPLTFADLKQGMAVSVIGTPTQSGKAANGRLAAADIGSAPTIAQTIPQRFLPRANSEQEDVPETGQIAIRRAEPAARKPITPREHSLSEAILLNLINGFRYRYDELPAVSANSALMAAAQRHARDMVENGTMTHRGSDLSSIADRVREAEYRADASTQQIIVGTQYATPQRVLDALIPLPLNRRNLLDKAWKDCGIAHRIFRNAQGEETHAWVIVFAQPHTPR